MLFLLGVEKFSTSSCSCNNMSVKILIAMTGLVLVSTVFGHCENKKEFFQSIIDCRKAYNLTNISINDLQEGKATCEYNSKLLICDKFQCNTATACAKSKGQIPSGDYRIEACRIHDKHYVPWFNLHSHSEVEHISIFWEYHTKSPAINCRSGLGLHYGRVSEGCITVTDETCWKNVVDYLTKFKPKEFETRQCFNCTPKAGETPAACNPSVPPPRMLNRWWIGNLTVN